MINILHENGINIVYMILVEHNNKDFRVFLHIHTYRFLLIYNMNEVIERGLNQTLKN